MRRKPCLKRTRLKTRPLLSVAIALIVGTSLACGSSQPDIEPPSEEENVSYEEQLILNNATLENVDDAGKPLWIIRSERAAYQPGQKDAQLEGITGNVYEAGEIVLKLKADKGEIVEDGQAIHLRDDVVATDPRTGVVLQSPEVQWSPEDGVLTVKQSFKSSSEDVEVTGKEATYTPETKVIEATDKVVINGKETPLQIRTEKAVWDIPKERITSDQPVEIDRYQVPKSDDEAAEEKLKQSEKSEEAAVEPFVVPPVFLRLAQYAQTRQAGSKPGAETETQPESELDPEVADPESAASETDPAAEKPKRIVTDRVTAKSAQFDLKKQVVILKKAVDARSVDPPLQVASDSIIWNLAERTVLSDTPVKIINRGDAITLTANEGFLDLEKEVVRVTGGARGINTRRPADLYANKIIWYIEPKRVEAAGNVIYKQAEPPLNLAGSTAVGQLAAQQLKVKSGPEGRVVTTIVP